MSSVANEVKYLEYPKGLHEIVAEAEHLEADRCICKVKKEFFDCAEKFFGAGCVPFVCRIVRKRCFSSIG